MKQGALIFDERSDRYDIRFDLADYSASVCSRPAAYRKPSLLHINRQEDYQPSRKYKRNDTTSFTPIRRGGMSARKQVRRNITIPP